MKTGDIFIGVIAFFLVLAYSILFIGGIIQWHYQQKIAEEICVDAGKFGSSIYIDDHHANCYIGEQLTQDPETSEYKREASWIGVERD